MLYKCANCFFLYAADFHNWEANVAHIETFIANLTQNPIATSNRFHFKTAEVFKCMLMQEL